MRVFFALAGIACLVGSLAALGSRTQVLSAAECEAVTGTLQDYICPQPGQGVGTCTDYNQAQHGMPSCVYCVSATGCQKCEFDVLGDGGNVWRVCQAQSGQTCTPGGGPATDCGPVCQGYCNGCTCDQINCYGEPDCYDAPSCSNP